MSYSKPTHPFSKYYLYKDLNPSDWTSLHSLSVATLKETGNVSTILGKGMEENQDLASAYSENNQLYPYAYFVFNKNAYNAKKPLGFVLVSDNGSNYEVSAVTQGDDRSFTLVEILSEVKSFVKELSCKTGKPVICNITDERANRLVEAFID